MVIHAVGTLLVVTGLVACGGGTSERRESRTHQPYGDLVDRPIRGLSPDRVADLLAGRGAGYALAAELNGYPGPMHVLDLADELGLTRRQRNVARGLRAANHRQARTLGRRLVALEADLDRAFRAGRISGTVVERMTAEIASTDARLRALHLAAHLAMRDALEPAQVARYAQLRGYRPRTEHAPGRHGP